MVCVGMEVDTPRDPIAVWKGAAGFALFPDQPIPCPLSHDGLREYYSLDRVASQHLQQGYLYYAQQIAYRGFLVDPPLTKALAAKRSGRANMQPMAESSIANRLSTLQHFVGFCVLWQGRDADMALVMEPMLAAKFVGFQIAKGNQASTIHQYARQLGQAVHFIISEHCPGVKPWTQGHIAQTLEWYKNMSVKAFPELLLSPPQDSKEGPTLWEVWQHAEKQWQVFSAAHQV